MMVDAEVSATIPYEVRIGVTGHRNLPDSGAVEHAVQALLEHIQHILDEAALSPRADAGSHHTLVKRCDHLLTQAANLIWRWLPIPSAAVPREQRTPVSWVVVSPLAKGADRIVARAVLRRSQPEGKPRLQVVTPFALDDYSRDFSDPQDRAEFDELLALDPAPTILPNDYGLPEPGDSPEEVALKQQRRNDGYFAVGTRVVDACEILIVIWDGQPSAGRGGTGDTVAYAVEQGRTILWIDSNRPLEAARQIVGPAPENLAPDEQIVQGFVHRPLPERAKQLSYGFHRLAAYNRDPAFDQQEYLAIIDRNRRQLDKAAQDAGLSPDEIGGAIDCLLPHYARADQLAIRYQQLYVRAAQWLQRLSSIAVTVVVVQVLFFPHHLWLIAFEVFAMLLAVALVRISQGEAWHEKWLRDRHLAERIRIAMFAALAKSDQQVRNRPDEALPFYQSTDDWIVDACDRLGKTAQVSSQHSVAFKPLKRFLMTAWINDQAKYHEKNSKRKGKACHRAHRLGLAFFCVTMLMALLHLLGVGHATADEHGSEHGAALLGQFITALAITLPAWGATIHAVNTLLERERISTRSAQMAKVLRQIARQAEQAEKREDFLKAVAHAEEIMLMENHEWWVSLSFRPPVLPA